MGVIVAPNVWCAPPRGGMELQHGGVGEKTELATGEYDTPVPGARRDWSVGWH